MSRTQEDLLSEDLWKEDIWVAASERGVPNRMSPFLEVEQAVQAPPELPALKRKGVGPGLPFRIKEFRMAKEIGALNDGVFVHAQPQQRVERPRPPSSWRFLPPLFDQVEDDQQSEDGLPPLDGAEAWSEEVTSEEAQAILAELRDSLAMRDGRSFDRARAALTRYANLIPVEAVDHLDEAVRVWLAGAWWSFVEDDAEAAERFRDEHIGPPVQIDKTPSTVTPVDADVSHMLIRRAGLLLGPRFRTRQTQYASPEFVMRPR